MTASTTVAAVAKPSLTKSFLQPLPSFHKAPRAQCCSHPHNTDEDTGSETHSRCRQSSTMWSRVLPARSGLSEGPTQPPQQGLRNSG